MDWVLNHTHLPGLDSLQTVGAAAAMWVGVIVGKAIVNVVSGAVNYALSQARKK